MLNRSVLRWSPFALLAATACSETVINETHVSHHYGGAAGEGGRATGGQASSSGGRSNASGGRTATGGSATGGSGPVVPLPDCKVIVPLSDAPLDLFGTDGNEFYFDVSDEQREIQDTQQCNGYGYGYNPGPVYELGEGEDSDPCPSHAKNVFIRPAGSNICAETGKVEVELPGQSSWRDWMGIPNIKLDVHEFKDQKFPGGTTTVRMNNGQADSTIVREATALAIWRALGYPAPRTRYVKTQSSVWDDEVGVGTHAAHVLVEKYKKTFFAEAAPTVTDVWEGASDPFYLGGGCGKGCYPEPLDAGAPPAEGAAGPGDYDLLEGFVGATGPYVDAPAYGAAGGPAGDYPDERPGGGYGYYYPPGGAFSGFECEWSKGDDCDTTKILAVVAAVNAAPQGAGFMAATQHVIDWPMLHKNQCLSAITSTGDDWIHNTNNVVIALREDGRIFFLPYSTDISGGHPWGSYTDTPYDGYASLVQACRYDPECRTAALDACDAMLDDYEALDVPSSIVAERCGVLESTGLLRRADIQICDEVASFYAQRGAEIRAEVEMLRNSQNGTGGGYGYGGEISYGGAASGGYGNGGKGGYVILPF